MHLTLSLSALAVLDGVLSGGPWKPVAVLGLLGFVLGLAWLYVSRDMIAGMLGGGATGGATTEEGSEFYGSWAEGFAMGAATAVGEANPLAGAMIDVHSIEEVETRVLLLAERAQVSEDDRLVRIEFTVSVVPCDTMVADSTSTGVYDPSAIRVVPCEPVVRGALRANAGEDAAEIVRLFGRAVRVTPIREDGIPLREMYFDRPQRFEGLFACPAALVGRCVFAYGDVTLGDFTLPSGYEAPKARAA